MKVLFKYLIAILVVGAIAGYIYWQKNKKVIIKQSIQNAIQKKTDSLYFIHYDSLNIDEVNGNASFYKVTLQSDSVQKAMLNTIDSLPNALYNIRVDEVTARGVDMAGLLQKNNVSAKSILLNKPIIQIINTGVDRPKPYTYNDTLELYQKITGKFKSIHADTIQVVNGTILITDKKGKALTTLENINVTLHNFLIDSTRNYQNIISYFIKDVKATVENIQLPESKNGSRVNITKLLYNAPEKILQVNSIQQYSAGNTTPVIDVKNVQVNQLNTDAFILNQQLKAGLVTCDGGVVTVYRKGKKKMSGEEAIEISSDLIDEAQIGGIKLANTKIIVKDLANADENPFIINDVTFLASNVVSLTNGSTINNLINNAEWKLSAGGFSFITKDKLYKFIAAGLLLNNKAGTIKIKQILLKPQLSEAEFVRVSKVQRDRLDLSFSNILLQGVNFKKLVSAKILEVESVYLQPSLKIFDDRTLPFSTISKVDKYPQQLLVNLNFPFYIKKVRVNNGTVFYKEKARKSEMAGTPNFTNINGVIANVTNIPARIRANKIMNVNVSSLFLGTASIKTEWLLPLNLQDTVFTVTGEVGPMDATVLNQIIEPLGMASVKKGQIKKLSFDLTCDNYKGKGHVVFLYNDLKVEVLKMSDDELKKRGLATFLANTFIKNDNPSKNNTYTGTVNFNRDIYKSFFNLLWKSVFDGVKKTVLRK